MSIPGPVKQVEKARQKLRVGQKIFVKIHLKKRKKLFLIFNCFILFAEKPENFRCVTFDNIKTES